MDNPWVATCGRLYECHFVSAIVILEDTPASADVTLMEIHIVLFFVITNENGAYIEDVTLRLNICKDTV